MQAQLPSPAALRLYLDDLVCLTDAQFLEGLTRARRELETYGKFPSVFQILKLAGVPVGEERDDIEAAAAWDRTLVYVRKFVSSTPEGEYYAVHSDQLPPAIVVAVRRTGGWGALKCMTRENEPFKRKDFLAHYKLAVLEPLAGTLIPRLDGMVKNLAQLKAMDPGERK